MIPGAAGLVWQDTVLGQAGLCEGCLGLVNGSGREKGCPLGSQELQRWVFQSCAEVTSIMWQKSLAKLRIGLGALLCRRKTLIGLFTAFLEMEN